MAESAGFELPLPLRSWLARADVGSPAWWQAVQAEGTPLQAAASPEAGPPDHCALLFLWRDPHGGPAHSPVQAVWIEVDGHTPHPVQALTPLLRWGHTDVWYWATTLPVPWLGSYTVVPVTGAQAQPPRLPSARRHWWRELLATQAQADPLSPWPAQSLGWPRPRAALRLGPAGHTPALPLPLRGQACHWTWHSPQLGRSRPVSLYVPAAPPLATPPVQAGARACTSPAVLPWVLLLDGQVWAGPHGVFSALDTLVSQGHLAPACYLTVDALDPLTRWAELGCHAPFWQAVHTELLPAARQQAQAAGLPLPAGRLSLAGQSLGGLAAAYAALHWPQHHGAVLCQSGSFWWPSVAPGPEHAALLAQVPARVRAAQGAGLRQRWLLQVGRHEDADMQQLSHAMAAQLRAAGQPVGLSTFAGGHDWLCWREGLLAGLMSLWPGPAAQQAAQQATQQPTPHAAGAPFLRLEAESLVSPF